MSLFEENDLGAGAYSGEKENVFESLVSKPVQRKYQPFGGPMPQAPQPQPAPIDYGYEMQPAEPSNVFDELDAYDTIKQTHGQFKQYATENERSAKHYEDLYDNFVKTEFQPFFNSVGGFGDFEDDDEMLSFIDQMKADELKASQEEDGWFGGASDRKLAAQENLKKFALWDTPNGLRDKYLRLKSEKDRRRQTADAARQKEFELFQQLTNIPIPARDAMDERLKARSKAPRSKKQTDELLDQFQFEKPAYDLGTGEVINIERTDPRKRVSGFDLGTGQASASVNRQRQRLASAIRGDIKGFTEKRNLVARERQIRDKGVVFSQNGLMDGRPVGLSRNDVDLLDIEDMRKAGVTSYKGKPLEAAMEELGGEERLKAAKIMEAVYGAKSNYEDAQLAYLKVAGSDKAEAARERMEAVREDMQKVISLAAESGLDNELFEQAETVGWLGGLGNAIKRGALMSEMSNYTPDFLTNTLDADEMQRFIEIASEIEKLPTSSTMKRVRETKSDGFLDAMGNLLFDNPAAIPEMFVESLSSFLPATIKWLIPSAGAGAAIGAIGGPGGAVAGAGVGARASWGVASFVLEASGMALEGMQELGVDWKNPKVFAAAWTNESIRNKIKKKMVQKGVPIAAADMLTGFMAGKVMGVANHTGNAMFKGGKLLDKSAWNNSKGSVARFTTFQKTRNAAAELGFDSTMGMSGEYLGQWASKEPGEAWDWDAIAAEGLVGVGPGILSSALEMRGRNANYFSNAPIEISGEQATETGSMGTITRAGYTAPYQTFNDADSMVEYLSGIPGVSPESLEFTNDFLQRMFTAKPEAMASLKVAISPRTPDSNMANRGQFESRDGHDVIYINEKEFAADPMGAFMHESGHFARVFILSDQELNAIWEGLGPDAQLEAYAQYFTKKTDQSFDSLPENEQKKIKRAFDQMKRTSPDVLAEEWFSYQWGRVLTQDGKPDPSVAKKLKSFKDKVLHEAMSPYVGTENLSGGEKGVILDQKIKDFLGMENAMPEPATPDAEGSQTNPTPQTAEQTERKLNAMPGTPKEKSMIARALNAMAGQKLLTESKSFYTPNEALRIAAQEKEEEESKSKKSKKVETPADLAERDSEKAPAKAKPISKDLPAPVQAKLRARQPEAKGSLPDQTEAAEAEMWRLDRLIPESEADRKKMGRALMIARGLEGVLADEDALNKRIDKAVKKLGKNVSVGSIIAEVLRFGPMIDAAPISIIKELRKEISQIERSEGRQRMQTTKAVEDMLAEARERIDDVVSQLENRIADIDRQINSLKEGVDTQKPKVEGQRTKEQTGNKAYKLNHSLASINKDGKVTLDMKAINEDWDAGFPYLLGKDGRKGSQQKKEVFKEIDIDEFKKALKTPKRYAQFIKLHEEGHKSAGDHGKYPKDWMSPEAIRMERLANKYAFEKMGIDWKKLKVYPITEKEIAALEEKKALTEAFIQITAPEQRKIEWRDTPHSLYYVKRITDKGYGPPQPLTLGMLAKLKDFSKYEIYSSKTNKRQKKTENQKPHHVLWDFINGGFDEKKVKGDRNEPKPFFGGKSLNQYLMLLEAARASARWKQQKDIGSDPITTDSRVVSYPESFSEEATFGAVVAERIRRRMNRSVKDVNGWPVKEKDGEAIPQMDRVPIFSTNPTTEEVLALKIAGGATLEGLGDPADSHKDFDMALYVVERQRMQEEQIDSEKAGKADLILDLNNQFEYAEEDGDPFIKVKPGAPLSATLADIISLTARRRLLDKYDEVIEEELRGEDRKHKLIELEKITEVIDGNIVEGYTELVKNPKSKLFAQRLNAVVPYPKQVVKDQSTEVNTAGFEVKDEKNFNFRRPLEDTDVTVKAENGHGAFTASKVFETFDVMKAYAKGRELKPGEFDKQRTSIDQSEQKLDRPTTMETGADLLSSVDINAVDFAQWFFSGENKSEKRKGDTSMSRAARQMVKLAEIPSSEYTKKEINQLGGGLGEGLLPFVFADFITAMHKKFGIKGFDDQIQTLRDRINEISQEQVNEQGTRIKEAGIIKPADLESIANDMVDVSKPIVQAVLDAEAIDVYGQFDPRSESILEYDTQKGGELNEDRNSEMRDDSGETESESVGSGVEKELEGPLSDSEIDPKVRKEALAKRRQLVIDKFTDAFKLNTSKKPRKGRIAVPGKPKIQNKKGIYQTVELTAEEGGKTNTTKPVKVGGETFVFDVDRKPKKTASKSVERLIGYEYVMPDDVLRAGLKSGILPKEIEKKVKIELERRKKPEADDDVTLGSVVNFDEVFTNNPKSLNSDAGKPETGKPITLKGFHGSNQAKTVYQEGFDPEKLGSFTGAVSAREGFFFARRPKTARRYSGTFGPVGRLFAKLVEVFERQTPAVSPIKDIYYSYREAFNNPEQKEGLSLIEEKLFSSGLVNSQGKWNNKSEQKTVDKFLKSLDSIKTPKGLAGNAVQVLKEQFKETQKPVEDKRGLIQASLEFNNPYVVDFKGKNRTYADYVKAIKKAKKDGHDGAVLLNTFDPMADDIYVAFSASQISMDKLKDRTLNSDAGRVLTSDVDPNLKKATLLSKIASDRKLKKEFKEWAAARKESYDKGSFRMNMMDRMSPVKLLSKSSLEVFEKLGLKKGSLLHNWLDVHGRSHQYFGKGGNGLEQSRLNYYDPLIEIMRKHNVTQKDVGAYLIARAAPSRNLQIEAKANEVLSDMRKENEEGKGKEYKDLYDFYYDKDGNFIRNSGVETKKALEVMAEMESDPDFVKFLEEYLPVYYDMNKDGLDQLSFGDLIRSAVSDPEVKDKKFESIDEKTAMITAASRFDFNTGKADKYGNKYKSKVKLADNYSYSPLQGFEGETEQFFDQEEAWEEFGSKSTGSGKGFNQPKTDLILHGAFGRKNDGVKSYGPDPETVVGNAINQHTAAMIRAKKNEVSQSFGDMYSLLYSVLNPTKKPAKDSSEFFDLSAFEQDPGLKETHDILKTIHEPGNEKLLEELSTEFNKVFGKPFESSETKTAYKVQTDDGGVDAKIGLIRRELTTTFKDDQSVFVYRRGGVPRFIRFNDRTDEGLRMADAMNNLRYESLPPILNGFNVATRLMAKMFTSANLAFILPNFFRDVLTARIHLSEDNKKVLIKDALNRKNLAGFMKAIYQAEADIKKGVNPNKKEEISKILALREPKKILESGNRQAMYQYYKENGGKVDMFRHPTLVERIKDIHKSLEGKDGWTKDSWKKFWNFVDTANTAVENSIRASTFWAAIKDGRPTDEAAVIARNVTVDFNQKGNLTQTFGSLYVFFGASMNSIDRFFTTFSRRSPKERAKLIAGIAGAAFIINILNRLMDDDEDEEMPDYDTISSYKRDTNAILPLPAGLPEFFNDEKDTGFFSLPLPLGYNLFWTMGQVMGDMFAKNVFDRGGAGLVEAITRFKDSSLSAFNPVGGSSGLAVALTPTPFVPLIELYANKNFMGRPIRHADRPFEVPEPGHMQDPKSTPEHWNKLSEAINTLMGGDDDVKGSFAGMLGNNPLYYRSDEDIKFDISGNQMRHLVLGYLGGPGQKADALFGSLFSVGSGKPSIENVNDIPIVNRFLRATTYGSATRVTFYEVRDAVKNAEKAVKSAKQINAKTYNAVLQDNQELLKLSSSISQLDKQKNKMRRLKKQIEGSKTLTEEQKTQRVDDLQKKELDLMVKVIKQAQKLGIR